MLSVHTTLEKFEKLAITGHYWICISRKTGAGKSKYYRNVIGFENHIKTRSDVFKSLLPFKSVFEKLRFRDGLVCTVGLTVEINPSLHMNFSIAVCTGLWITQFPRAQCINHYYRFPPASGRDSQKFPPIDIFKCLIRRLEFSSIVYNREFLTTRQTVTLSVIIIMPPFD